MPSPQRVNPAASSQGPAHPRPHRGPRGRRRRRGRLPHRRQAGGEVPTVIVNGAECEPLLHKDKELMQHEAAPMLRGLAAVMRLVSAEQGIVGIKNKYTAVQEALAPQAARGRSHPAAQRHLPGRRRVPAGLRRAWPRHPARRPAEGRRRRGGQRRDRWSTSASTGPVTHKYLTVAGAVRTPVTLARPVGIRIGDLHRGGRRGNGRRRGGAARRRHDGTPGRQPR